MSGRNKIKYSYEDYISTLSGDELTVCKKRLAPLISILEESENDREILSKMKAYDTEHGTDMFAEAIQFTVYCIACSKFACDC